MATIFIFHGIGGSPNENWFPWLKKELNEQGHRVIVPAFPRADKPQLDEWHKHMERYEESIDENTVFVGHSLGGIFVLRLLEKMQTPIHATFLVASVTGPDDGLDFATLMTAFTDAPLDRVTIKKNAGSIHAYHAENDPYIPLEHIKELAAKLGATLDIIPNGRHLNESNGFREFPLLRERILSIL